jgi:hypothetical protein
MSESLVMGITYLLTWVSQPGACMKCLALNGKTWELDDLDLWPFILETVSHPHCRCEVDVEINVNPEELQIW